MRPRTVVAFTVLAIVVGLFGYYREWLWWQYVIVALGAFGGYAIAKWRDRPKPNPA